MVSTRRGRIPEDFVTAWVLRCRSETRDVPGQGKKIFQIAERADTGAAELVARLRRPSEPRTDGPCPAIMVVAPYFVLVNADGRGILPAVPANACGQPNLELVKPLDSMAFRVLSEVATGQAQSQNSADTGCSDSWKDLVALEERTARPGPARHLWSYPVSSVRVCVYDRISGGDLPVGRLAGGRSLAAEDARLLLDALDGVGPAGACTAPHTRIAVVHGGAQWAVAELDGCRRLLRPDHTLGQLDERVVALLG
jgi:hypothetical protein